MIASSQRMVVVSLTSEEGSAGLVSANFGDSASAVDQVRTGEVWGTGATTISMGKLRSGSTTDNRRTITIVVHD